MKRTNTLEGLLLNLGSVVKSQREQLGITQEELARRAGLHRTYITDVEGGKRNITIESMLKLASALNVSIADIFSKAEKKGTTNM